MTDILITSDWHGRIPAAPFDKADFVIFAGDIANDLDTGRKLITEAIGPKRHVYVLGNHEYYDGTLRKLVEDGLVATTGTDFIDGIAIFHATGWYDFSYSENDVFWWRTRIRDSLFLDLDFIEAQREFEARRFRQFLDLLDGPAIVATHVPPLKELVDTGRYQGSSLNGSFFSHHLYHVAKTHRNHDKILIWAYGHNHVPADIMIDGIRFISAPLGMPHEHWCHPGYRLIRL